MFSHRINICIQIVWLLWQICLHIFKISAPLYLIVLSGKLTPLLGFHSNRGNKELSPRTNRVFIVFPMTYCTFYNISSTMNNFFFHSNRGKNELSPRTNRVLIVLPMTYCTFYYISLTMNNSIFTQTAGITS